MKLNQIRDNQGARYKSKALGRGIASGKGKTAGRGGKGQTARSGVRLKGFQGGQMPLSRRLPKRGFTNIHRCTYVEINIGQLQQAIDEGRIINNKLLTEKDLQKAGLFKKMNHGVRILGDGLINQAIQLSVTGASQTALKAVQSAGGSITFHKK